jgi:hypothetical protein
MAISNINNPLTTKSQASRGKKGGRVLVQFRAFRSRLIKAIDWIFYRLKAEIDGLEYAVPTARAGGHFTWVAILSSFLSVTFFLKRK